MVVHDLRNGIALLRKEWCFNELNGQARFKMPFNVTWRGRKSYRRSGLMRNNETYSGEAKRLGCRRLLGESLIAWMGSGLYLDELDFFALPRWAG